MRLPILRLIFSLWLLTSVAPLFAEESTTMKLEVGGVSREALVVAPAAPSGDAKEPVVFVFHPHGGLVSAAAESMPIAKEWPEALVVYMQGLPTAGMLGDPEGRFPGWQQTAGQLGDRDLKFFDALLAELHQKYPIDDHRIYAVGFSNGGFFTYLLWAQRPKVFAGFAVGACNLLPSVNPTEPRPVFHAAGESDMLVMFSQQEETVARLRKLNGCSEQSEPCGEGCVRYPSSTGTPVEMYKFAAGHSYPPEMTGMLVKFLKEQTPAQ